MFARPPIPRAPFSFTSPGTETYEKDGIEIIYHDPSYRVPVQVKKESDVARSSAEERPSGGEANNRRRDNHPMDNVNSPAPTNQYAPTELGPDEVDYFEPGGDDLPDGDDPGDGGDGNGGNGGGGPPSPPDDKPEGNKGRKIPKKKGNDPNPPDGGDDGYDDPDDDDDDDDEKFRRRMIKISWWLRRPKA